MVTTGSTHINLKKVKSTLSKNFIFYHLNTITMRITIRSRDLRERKRISKHIKTHKSVKYFSITPASLMNVCKVGFSYIVILPKKNLRV
jgi:hypothetical protein